MAKIERKKTIVYSNVSKEAENKSALKENIIDLDDEIFIGMHSSKKVSNKNSNSGTKKSGSGKVTKDNSWKNAEEKSVQPNKEKNGVNIKPKNSKEGWNADKGNERLMNGHVSRNNNSIKVEKMREKLKRQKVRAIRKMSVLVILIIMLIGGVVNFFLSPIFDVKNIDVINNSYFSTEQIINTAGIRVNENTFKFSRKEAEKRIMANAYVESVKVSRNILKNSVSIDIKERIPVLMLEYGSSYAYISSQGYILEISSEKLGCPILKGYSTQAEDIKAGNRINKNDLERLETVLGIMEMASSNGLDNLISQIDISNRNNYTLLLEAESKTVHLGSCSDLSTQMLYVKEMVEREKGIEGDFFVNMDLNTRKPVFREKV